MLTGLRDPLRYDYVSRIVEKCYFCDDKDSVIMPVERRFPILIDMFRKIIASCMLLCAAALLSAQDRLDWAEFSNPDTRYGLDIWWHWPNGNISREAIRKDLCSMHANGIKRATILNADGTGQFVPRVTFASSEWLGMFRYALDVADSLGMTIGVHNCDGWSESGGPWIPVEKSMKTYTWSDTPAKGGRRLDIVLPRPPCKMDYYRDYKVVAFPDTGSGESGFLNFRELFAQKSNTGIRDIEPRFAEDAVPVESGSVVDITDCMQPDGRLVWKAPKGKWRIVRMGYTTTAEVNKPATPEGTGLECDKMDASAVELHFMNFPTWLVQAAGPHVGKAFEFLLIDSWECKYTNWTEGFQKEFEALSGYPLVGWIPAMCGYVVDSPERTAGFLHDYQKTIATLIDRNYYQKFAELTHAAGLDLHAEPIYGNSLEYPPAFCLRGNSYCDVPMTEFWAYPGADGRPDFDREEFLFDEFAIDAALVCGKDVIGAEAYTADGRFCDEPQLLRPFGDAAFCAGINQLVLHSYVMQPFDREPVLMLMDYFGGHFNRNNPWWTMAAEWCMYQKRIQYVTQQGKPVVDALYYIGDQFTRNFPLQLTHHDVPFGYRACSCDYAYLDRLVADGFNRLIIPEGVMLEQRTKDKLAELATAGVEIYYAKNGEPIPFDIAPDFATGNAARNFRFLHKHFADQEAYLLFNQSDEAFSGEVVFRTSGMVPELWDPETGKAFAPAAWKDLGDGRTAVEVDFKALQTMFVVFGAQSSAPDFPKKKATIALDDYLATLSFDPVYDDEIEGFRCKRLQSLTLYEDEKVREFGGFVNYRIEFDAPEGIREGDRLAINIGRLDAVAGVRLNGAAIGDVWHDDTDLFIDGLLPEGNVLEVRLATTLHNRMTADVRDFGKPVHIAGPMSDGALSYFAGSRLFESGLLGPLSISVYQR